MSSTRKSEDPAIKGHLTRGLGCPLSTQDLGNANRAGAGSVGFLFRQLRQASLSSSEGQLSAARTAARATGATKKSWGGARGRCACGTGYIKLAGWARLGVRIPSREGSGRGRLKRVWRVWRITDNRRAREIHATHTTHARIHPRSKTAR